jgi:outer membrane protein assembly factor BamB
VAAALLGVACAALAGCGGWNDVRAPWEHAHDHDVGRPVLGFRWQRTIFDHTSAIRPEEPAGVAVYPARDAHGQAPVYVGSHEGTLHALAAGDGHVLWEKKLGSMSGEPVLVGDTLYVGTDEGLLYALDPTTGHERWRHQAKGPILRPPAFGGDTLVFTTELDKVVALDRATGKFRWHYERETPDEFTLHGNAGATIVDNRVYAGFADGHVVALSLAAGEVAWVRSLAGEAGQFVDVDTTPIVDHGVVYAASAAGGLYALAAADGTERWRVPMAGAAQLLLEGGRLYAVAADEGLYAIDLGGHVLWRQGFPKAGDPAQPTALGTYLFLTFSDGGLYVVDKRDGELVQAWNPGSGFSAPVTIANGLLYILSNAGIVYAMNVSRFS